MNQANLDAIGEIYPTYIVWHVPEGDIQGSEQVKQVVGMYLSAFPDLNVPVEDVIVEDDKAVTCWTMRGTHQGDLMGIAPTERQIEVDGITIHRIPRPFPGNPRSNEAGGVSAA